MVTLVAKYIGGVNTAEVTSGLQGRGLDNGTDEISNIIWSKFR